MVSTKAACSERTKKFFKQIIIERIRKERKPGNKAPTKLGKIRSVR